MFLNCELSNNCFTVTLLITRLRDLLKNLKPECLGELGEHHQTPFRPKTRQADG
jgi:hypothetical protein